MAELKPVTANLDGDPSAAPNRKTSGAIAAAPLGGAPAGASIGAVIGIILKNYLIKDDPELAAAATGAIIDNLPIILAGAGALVGMIGGFISAATAYFRHPGRDETVVLVPKE